MSEHIFKAALVALVGFAAFYLAYSEKKKGVIKYTTGEVQATEQPRRFGLGIALTIAFGVILEVFALIMLVGIF